MKVSVVNPQRGYAARGGNLKQKSAVAFRGNSDGGSKPKEKGVLDLLKEHKVAVSVAVGILAVLAAVGFVAMKKNEAAKAATNADGDTFKPQASMEVKKNPQITGASNKHNWEKPQVETGVMA